MLDVLDKYPVLSALLPFVYWSTLPGIGTQLALHAFYTISPSLRPTTQSDVALHFNRARVLVVSAYLFYTLHQALVGASPNFYTTLGLPLDVETEHVPRAFRKLARIYHPDKVGPRGEAFFIAARTAADVIGDPTKRYAYDRFGPSVIAWEKLYTVREHMGQGFQEALPYYVLQPAILSFINWLNGDGFIDFWRATLFMLMASSELYLCALPERPALLVRLLPNTTQAEVVSFMHELFLSVMLASKQIAPLIPKLGIIPSNIPRYGKRTNEETQRDLQELDSVMVRLAQLAEVTRGESQRGVAASLEPLRPSQRPSAQTLQQAAQEAAKAGAPPRPKGAFLIREPSQVEQTWMHLFAREVFRKRVENSRLEMGLGSSERSDGAPATAGAPNGQASSVASQPGRETAMLSNGQGVDGDHHATPGDHDARVELTQ
ncbi:Molecular chaperone (DnaJ superfamily) [Ceraceosorus bombacis]|uniref:Molecular chaperone (DnaJ superfamily) n=1 Tax=Ceraceosorus bombacis TaxID=401625 RepID=A0A0P1BC38_9BASI|nr:Molecular chaperone (DnaJ superfamily) [Ceraceosorus bombacis]